MPLHPSLPFDFASFDFASFDFASFDFASFDFASFDFASFDFAQDRQDRQGRQRRGKKKKGPLTPTLSLKGRGSCGVEMAVSANRVCLSYSNLDAESTP